MGRTGLAQRRNRFIAALVMALCSGAGAVAQENLVTRWSEAYLQAIREAKPSAPVVSRLLAVAHTCIYDAWTAFDAKAVGVHFNTRGEQRLKPVDVNERNRGIALSFAAHDCGAQLLPKSAPLFAQLLEKSWPERRPEDIPAENLGHAAAQAVLQGRANDGANAGGELGCRYPGAAPEYCDYSAYEPRNGPTLVLDRIDPVRWQPISTGEGYQLPLAPYWGKVRPFSFVSAAAYLGEYPIPKPRLPKAPGSPRYQQQVDEIIQDSRLLGDERNAMRKAMALYWAEGPGGIQLPGQLAEMAQFVAKRDKLNLDQSAKLFFALHNAAFDAGIVVWHLAYQQDYGRPISLVRHALRGKSVLAWGGPGAQWDGRINAITGKPYGYNRWVRGEEWAPYGPGSTFDQRWTPAMPEYVSSHAAFAAAGAQVLKMFTGSPNFGFEAAVDPTAEAWRPALIEGPELQAAHRWRYPSFVSAANQAGWSRRYAGVQFEDGDLVARAMGKRIGHQVWEKAWYLFNGGDGFEPCRKLKRCVLADAIYDGKPGWVNLQ